jgi:hypothetical protein
MVLSSYIATSAGEDQFINLQSSQLLFDPAIKSFVGLSENAWDFAAPDGVPGFAPLHAHQISPR